MTFEDIDIRSNPNGTFTVLYKGIARRTFKTRVEAGFYAHEFIWTEGGKNSPIEH